MNSIGKVETVLLACVVALRLSTGAAFAASSPNGDALTDAMPATGVQTA